MTTLPLTAGDSRPSAWRRRASASPACRVAASLAGRVARPLGLPPAGPLACGAAAGLAAASCGRAGVLLLVGLLAVLLFLPVLLGWLAESRSERAARWHADGASQAAIARRLGVSRRTVGRLLGRG